MVKWLAVAAVLPLLVATAAHAQMKGLAPADLAGVARNHMLDLRISQQQGIDGPMPLIRGMVVQRDVAANAFVGVGLASMYGRKKATNSIRITDPPIRSRKPAVTFVLKF
jgi:hypothetical protein